MCIISEMGFTEFSRIPDLFSKLKGKLTPDCVNVFPSSSSVVLTISSMLELVISPINSQLLSSGRPDR